MHNALNSYRIMWLFVFFDLPTSTKLQRKNYAKFRKDLLKDGFIMMQFSVYSRHCASWESAQVHISRVKKNIPLEGHVSIIQITDKQYEKIINFWGRKTQHLDPAPSQLELF